MSVTRKMYEINERIKKSLEFSPMTKSIDEWAADKCGVELRQIRCGDESRAHMFKLKGKTYWFEWTIKDPRCREIVREHFELTTYYIKLNSGKNWTCQTGDKGPYGRGKTIAEAEIACITAIYEAEK